jgi:hypothetical protein
VKRMIANATQIGRDVARMDNSVRLRLAESIFRGAVAILLIGAVGSVLFYINATLGLYDVLPDVVVNAFNIALPFLMVGGAVGAVWKRISLPCTLPLLIATAAFLTYLAWDDTELPSPPSLPPVAPQNAKSFTTYRWLLKSGPGTRLHESPLPKVDLPQFPAEKKEWSDFVRKNRSAWEAAWAEDKLGREWLAVMAEQEFEGVYPNEGSSTPLLDFARVKRAITCQWARAHLLLDESKPEESVRVLIVALRAGYHLQRTGTTLVTQMIGSVCTKGSYERLALLLDSGALSPEAKAEIGSALREAPDVRQNLALAFAGEEIYARSSVVQMRESSGQAWEVAGGTKPRYTPSFAGRLLFNPNRTERQHVEFLRDTSRLAQARQLGQSGSTQRFEDLTKGYKVKNPVGHILASMSLTAFEKVTEAFWKEHDLRLALLQRLDRIARS